MPALASVAELAAYLGRDVDEARGALALDIASDLVRSEAGQTLSYVENDVAVLRGSMYHDLWLPERPVVDVTNVVGDGVRDDWHVLGGKLFRPYGWPETVTVTYSHGFTTLPSDVRGIVLAAAARQLEAATAESAVVSETVGSYSVTYARPRDGARELLTADERAHLRRTYRRTVGMVSVR